VLYISYLSKSQGLSLIKQTIKMDFSEDLRLRARLYFKEKHDLDLSDAQVVEALNNLADLYLEFSNISH
jgi:hypothetical protein